MDYICFLAFYSSDGVIDHEALDFFERLYATKIVSCYIYTDIHVHVYILPIMFIVARQKVI